MIKIFSTPSCTYCKTLKSYLTNNNKQFIDVDVSADENELNEMVKLSGQMSVPVLQIDKNVIIGFDKQKIDELLNLKVN